MSVRLRAGNRADRANCELIRFLRRERRVADGAGASAGLRTFATDSARALRSAWAA